jgi:hypothetical protein
LPWSRPSFAKVLGETGEKEWIMAYISDEIQNVRLVWLTVASKFLVVGSIILGLACASAVATMLGYTPADFNRVF